MKKYCESAKKREILILKDVGIRMKKTSQKRWHSRSLSV
jgi:hypothetical protein